MKKYFKYILLTFILLLGFNLDVKAAPEKISMSISEVKSNLCEYTYDGLTIKVAGTHDGKVIADAYGEVTNYQTYDISNLKDASYINKRECPNVYVYSRATRTPADAMGTVYVNDTAVFYYNKSQGEANSDEKYVTSLSSKVKRLTTACVYKANPNFGTADPITYYVIYNPLNNKIDTEIYGYDFQTQNLKIKPKVKKGWKYNSDGLICDKQKIIIDFCAGGSTSGGSITIRTPEDSMDNTCSNLKSTNPTGYGEVTQKDDKYNGEVKYLSDICDENETVVTIMRAVGYALVIVKILVPLLLIAAGIISFSKIVINGDEGETKKAASGLLIKFIAAVVIFVLPTIINFIFETIDGATDGTEDYENCRICIFEPGDCDIP